MPVPQPATDGLIAPGKQTGAPDLGPERIEDREHGFHIHRLSEDYLATPIDSQGH